MIKKIKLICILLTMLIGLIVVSTSVTYLVIKHFNSGVAVTSSDTFETVKIGELYGENGVNVDNVQTLINCLSNDSLGGFFKIKEYIENTDYGVITAEDIRGFSTGKKAGESVIVSFGGFDWLVSCVSFSSNYDDIIVTLWLVGDDIFDSSSYAYSEQNAYGVNNPSEGIPTNMYGTSYIRAKLNNGGYYAVVDSNASNPSSLTAEYEFVTDYQFSKFLSGGELNQYLVTPSQIWWQESGQEAYAYIYAYSNENWSDNISNSGFINSNYNYAGRYFDAPDGNQYGNGTWKDDYLWLPSITEVGDLWKVSVEERFGNADHPYWLRSAASDDSTQVLCSNSNAVFLSSSTVNEVIDIKPAIHLNLSKLASSIKNVYLAEELPEDVYVTVNGKLLQDKVSFITTEDSPLFEFNVVMPLYKEYTIDYWQVKLEMYADYEDIFSSPQAPLIYQMQDGYNEIWVNPVLTKIETFKGFAVSVELQNIQDSGEAFGEARITMYDRDLDSSYETIHLSAIAYKGYRFVGWKIDGELRDDYSGDEFMSVDISIQEIDDATERTIIAVFEKIDSDINDETDNN